MGQEKERREERQEQERRRERREDAERGFPKPIKPFKEDRS